jgi:DNA-binding SARP family transcriptional activator
MNGIAACPSGLWVADFTTGRALQTFHQLRSSLVTELGIEPSAQLQRLQHAVLSRGPSLDAA